MKTVMVLLLPVIFAACSDTAEKQTASIADTTPVKTAADTSSKIVHTFYDSLLEKKITNALLNLPFVIKSNNFIDSFSNHRHGIAFLLEDPAAGETAIPVQAGYNGKDRFETYYRFFVDPKTLEIKVYDPVTDKKLTVKEYEQIQQPL